ncbi:hypothetical protein, partial [Rivihabitans pingtungensis]|uniref:hypothetical protein n=1 Tax=Rivihabitans pingtungensis TaxID=1054498 RepID=UPI002FD9EADB
AIGPGRQRSGMMRFHESMNGEHRHRASGPMLKLGQHEHLADSLAADGVPENVTTRYFVFLRPVVSQKHQSTGTKLPKIPVLGQ